MKLSRVERWILSNQFKILEKVDPENAKYFENSREVVDSGYELEYDRIAEHTYRDEECMTEDECSEVYDVLSMHRDLKRSHDALADKNGIDEHNIEFWGFDGNEESRHLGYCQHVCDPSRGGFKELNRGRDDFNSHVRTIDGYRRMLDVWRPISKKLMRGDLTKEQMIAIINARAHPESPIGELRDAEPKGRVQ